MTNVKFLYAVLTELVMIKRQSRCLVRENTTSTDICIHKYPKENWEGILLWGYWLVKGKMCREIKYRARTKMSRKQWNFVTGRLNSNVNPLHMNMRCFLWFRDCEMSYLPDFITCMRSFLNSSQLFHLCLIFTWNIFLRCFDTCTVCLVLFLLYPKNAKLISQKPIFYIIYTFVSQQCLFT
jgi:hypothetical protein